MKKLLIVSLLFVFSCSEHRDTKKVKVEIGMSSSQVKSIKGSPKYRLRITSSEKYREVWKYGGNYDKPKYEMTLVDDTLCKILYID